VRSICHTDGGKLYSTPASPKPRRCCRRQGSQIRGKPVGYRPYRRGSVGVTDRFFDKTEPTKPAYSVNRSKTSIDRISFIGFENRYCSGFKNPSQRRSDLDPNDHVDARWAPLLVRSRLVPLLELNATKRNYSLYLEISVRSESVHVRNTIFFSDASFETKGVHF
jgi:hypothetical protein